MNQKAGRHMQKCLVAPRKMKDASVQWKPELKNKKNSHQSNRCSLCCSPNIRATKATVNAHELSPSIVEVLELPEAVKPYWDLFACSSAWALLRTLLHYAHKLPQRAFGDVHHRHAFGFETLLMIVIHQSDVVLSLPNWNPLWDANVSRSGKAWDKKHYHHLIINWIY